MRSTPAPVVHDVSAGHGTEDAPDQDPGGWGVTNHFLPFIFQEGGALVITFNLHR